MIVRSIINLAARKLITLPQLSPSHTSARLVKRLVPTGTHVIDYQPVMHLECSSDLIADPADRVTPNHQPVMLLECMEEGTIRWDESIDEHQWLEIGAALGEIIDEDDDDIDKNWEWQAYLHDEEG